MVGRLARLLCISSLVIAIGGAGLALAHPEPNDIDGDTVANAADNCPSVYNFDQADADGDGLGNRCDSSWDQDGDGIVNGYPQPPRVDNCPTVPNPGQTDTNGDGVGDACAIDSDGDTIFDFEDNCPDISNRFQGNTDGDDLGDACDPDIDGDGPPYSPVNLDNGVDNCPTVFNPDQRDDDRDGLGALCDADDVPRAGTAVPEGVAPGPGASTPATAGDSVPPTVTVRLARTQRLEEIRGGLVVAVRCSEACSVTARLTVDRRTARRLRLPASGLLAGGRAQVEAAASTYAFVRFTSAARRALSRQRRVRATLRVGAVDRAGNRRAISRLVTLRR
ncbi:MAG TPA: thrombospondin type 3 repeat-containing protein [Solirubrobacteraceae bacterium]|nr:thrombospondin type 3 repeat-containing protein [Solirubrobacteraceae bacterium]